MSYYFPWCGTGDLNLELTFDPLPIMDRASLMPTIHDLCDYLATFGPKLVSIRRQREIRHSKSERLASRNPKR